MLRSRYLSARDPRPELHTAKHESPWYGGLNRTLTRARARTLTLTRYGGLTRTLTRARARARTLTLTRYGGPAAARHARQELHAAKPNPNPNPNLNLNLNDNPHPNQELLTP